LERMKERLPPYLITVLENQYNRLNELDSLIEDIEKQLTSVAIVAMANKLARTVWAITAHGRKYDRNHVSIRPY
ncbi:IS110 family transposase, partial [Escherichia coli]|nr:IS110 family transposase [Escherichia coli]